MRSRGRILLFYVLCFFFCLVAIAQDSGKGRGSVGGRSRGSMVGSRGGQSSGGSSSSTSSSSVRSSPSRSGVSYGRTQQSYSGSGGGGSQVPSQTYTPNYSWSWSYWNRTNWYVSNLMRQYYFLPGYNYLWRFRQGDSPLTQRSMLMALQECTAASSGMLRLSDQLEGLISQYENGELSQADFERQVDQTTKQIRNLAKKIRKDDFLDFIDQRQKNGVDSFQETDSLQGLRALNQQLRTMASEVDSGLDAFHSQDMSRVVDVKELERPSFDALSEGIDRLAKTIDKSAGRL